MLVDVDVNAIQREMHMQYNAMQHANAMQNANAILCKMQATFGS